MTKPKTDNNTEMFKGYELSVHKDREMITVRAPDSSKLLYFIYEGDGKFQISSNMDAGVVFGINLIDMAGMLEYVSTMAAHLFDGDTDKYGNCVRCKEEKATNEEYCYECHRIVEAYCTGLSPRWGGIDDD